jgi:uncharacterized protein (TIGR00369 family)
MTEHPRSRTITWSDPAVTAGEGRGMAGLDYLLALKAGEMPAPPIILLLGIEIADVEAGRVVMTLVPGEHLYNPLGAVHGGAIATLLDSVMGCSVHSTLPKGRFYTTLELKVNYIRGITIETGQVSAEGKVVHCGRQSAVAEGRVTDGRGRILSTASTTCLVFELP